MLSGVKIRRLFYSVILIKGDGVQNEQHICKLVSNKEQLLIYNKSEKKSKKYNIDPKWPVQAHRDLDLNLMTL